MGKFVLAAPDAENRFLPDYRHSYQENSYTEVISVVDGICECNDVTTRDKLLRKGYRLIDLDWVCAVCSFMAVSAQEFKEHKKVHEKVLIKKAHEKVQVKKEKPHVVFEVLEKSRAILATIREAE